MLWADSSGNIGYKLVGKLPRRRGNCPDLPEAGLDRRARVGRLRAVRRAARGVEPAGRRAGDGQQPHRAGRLPAPHHERVPRRLARRSASSSSWPSARSTRSTTSRASSSTSSRSRASDRADRLARLRPPGQREVRAIERLKSWDHRLDAGLGRRDDLHVFIAPLRRCSSRRRRSATPTTPSAGGRSRSSASRAMNSAPWRFHARLIELWDEGDAELIGGRDWDELAIEALANALDDLEAALGADPDGWRWGDVHGRPLRAPARRRRARRLQPARAAAVAPPPRAGGGHETVNAIGFVPHDGDVHRHLRRRRYRLLADLGDPDASRWQHMTGQSGHPGSPPLRRPDRRLARRPHQPGRASPRRRRCDWNRPSVSRRDEITMTDEELRDFLDEQMVMQCATVGPNGPAAHRAALVRARRPGAARLDLRQVAEGEEPRARPAGPRSASRTACSTTSCAA